MKIEGSLPDGRLVMKTHVGTVIETKQEMRERLAAARADRLAAAAPDMLAELKALHEKNGWQSTADMIARIEKDR